MFFIKEKGHFGSIKHSLNTPYIEQGLLLNTTVMRPHLFVTILLFIKKKKKAQSLATRWGKKHFPNDYTTCKADTTVGQRTRVTLV